MKTETENPETATPTTEEILNDALELSLFVACDYMRKQTPEQIKRCDELIARCSRWLDRGYLVTGKRRDYSS